MDFFTRNIRALILVIGFGSGLLGTLGSFFFIENLNEQITDVTDQRDASVQEIARLGELSGNYFIANQQGDLIYALGLQQGARTDLLALIYQGNLLDRAEPIRNLMGAMATSGLLDYRKTYDEYVRLNDIARKSGDFDSYVAVKMYESTIVQQAQTRVAELQVGLAPLQQDISHAEGRLRNRHQLMIVLSSVGALLLLLANLVEHRRTASRAVEPSP